MQTYIIATAYFFFIVELLIISRSFFYARRERNAKWPTYTPKAAIIAPHYGWDADTETHAKGLLHQDYAGAYEVFFVTHQKADSGHDVSYPHLCEIAEPHPNIHVLLAPNIVENNLPRSQKVQNLLTAIEKLPDDIEVIAFVDADVAIRENWLTLLVNPLQKSDIGTTVGGRFYFPQTWNIASLVESIWVNFQMSVQGDHPFTMVWGGSNAFRREMLEKAKILQRWNEATIEDLNTTLAMRDVKQKVHFVPDCVAITRTANRTWYQIFEFTNRQVIMTFHMGLWVQWFASLIVSLPKGVCILGSLPFLFHRRELLPVIFIPFLEALSYRLFSKNLPRWLQDMPKVRQTISVSSYVTSVGIFLAGLNAVYAVFQRKITWGGVRYEILSATKCRVLGAVKRKHKDNA
ncbi:glycosyltransferase family 2 protein [Candidatus Poribacteria bacterium]|nr:glycosyltransferase family 2 protein [Candidatus Poribacteria bacterium]MYK94256.1 glycosyltransferase family 2 protein [Candidatus Poribacteria bacterium]